MTTAVFVDSTVLLYPLDRRAPTKQAACAAWLRSLRRTDGLVLSPQSLNESYWVVLRKPAFAAVRADIRAYLTDYTPWATAPLDGPTMLEAFAMEDRYGVRFWDALMLASANKAGCSFFLSEDLNDGQAYGAVQAVNPFRLAPEDVLGRAVLP
jgi:predicted nucleic acid-binding protein